MTGFKWHWPGFVARIQTPTWLVYLLIGAVTACSETSSLDSSFAGLGDIAEEGFRQPSPRDGIELPRDMGPHPDYRIEWWYLTANLTTAEGTPMGLQWTQFRRGLQPPTANDPGTVDHHWPLDTIWMSHAAVSFDGRHVFEERLARGGIGQTGATAEPFHVWLDDWQLSEGQNGHWELSAGAGAGDWHYTLRIRPQRPIVRHGQNGFSAKSVDGQGSMYFSFVDLAIDGTVTIDGQTLAVSGQGWFDREWSSQLLKAEEGGWDWLALHLGNGDKVMAFRLGQEDQPFRSATWVAANGEVETLSANQFTLEPLHRRKTSAGTVPDQWRLTIPSKNIVVAVTVPPGNYWNDGVFPYWESPVAVSGSHRGTGYLEMTGYHR
ncbi:lipocalin-like domain-containing protein [Marinobacter caseinilyticus]|uniref:lipocalin-like domain-containing protein n=1 Tax=Marinobacter caseinilyticus TaxID=2692195 RepID=UPI00140C42E6|nr:lipocalin-like domain-containing protein [Marinobacter caseinilyticus]